jgi:hypothetical protein
MYYEDGDEFHGISENDNFDLTTLLDLIEYARFLSKEYGECEIINNIKKTLRIFK